MPLVEKMNLLGEAINTVKDVWRHREGIKIPYTSIKIDHIKALGVTVELENKIPAAILDTVDVLWPGDKPRPLLTHQARTSNGWHMIFTLRPGVSYREVLLKQEYFADACRGQVKIEKLGGFVHLNVTTGEMQSYYPYEWDPANYTDMDLPIPIGYGPDGELVVVDLATLPHIREGGTTFTGKSNFLHNLFISLAMLDNVILAVIDLALLEFSYVKNYAAFASDTETALRLLRALEKEMHRRRQVLDVAGVEKIQEYKEGDLPFIVLLIDEFAFMNPDSTPDKEEKQLRNQCQAICSNLAALARKVGIHLVIAMQRPDMKILPGQLKANLPGAISFKTINHTNSEIILDNGAAAELPGIKGRAIWQVGNQQTEVQVMHLPPKKARKMLKKIAERRVGGFDNWIIKRQNERLLPR
jgi:S-DNA-T family DNA segregation ATPase FtsK/SpoIIIE